MVQIVGIVLIALIMWPIIVNSQPGTKFIAFGIDWKADNLDNTLFWTAIVLMIIASSVNVVEQKNKEKFTLKANKEIQDDFKGRNI